MQLDLPLTHHDMSGRGEEDAIDVLLAQSAARSGGAGGLDNDGRLQTLDTQLYRDLLHTSEILAVEFTLSLSVVLGCSRVYTPTALTETCRRSEPCVAPSPSPIPPPPLFCHCPPTTNHLTFFSPSPFHSSHLPVSLHLLSFSSRLLSNLLSLVSCGSFSCLLVHCLLVYCRLVLSPVDCLASLVSCVAPVLSNEGMSRCLLDVGPKTVCLSGKTAS